MSQVYKDLAKVTSKAVELEQEIQAYLDTIDDLRRERLELSQENNRLRALALLATVAWCITAIIGLLA